MSTAVEIFQTDTLFKKMVGVSVGLHLGLVGFFIIKTLVLPMEPVTFESAVRVDIVDLPTKDQALPQIAPPPPASPVAQIQPPAEVRPNLEKVKKQALEKLKAMEALDRLVEEEKKAEKENERQKKAEARAKLIADATNQIKGNRVSPGTSLKGLNRMEYDSYISAIDAHVKNQWTLPEWLSKSRLKAKARVFISDRGLVTNRSLIESSGNPTYDQLVLQAIDQSSPFPTPPDKFVDVLAHDGIVFGFPE